MGTKGNWENRHKFHPKKTEIVWRGDSYSMEKRTNYSDHESRNKIKFIHSNCLQTIPNTGVCKCNVNYTCVKNKKVIQK